MGMQAHQRMSAPTSCKRRLLCATRQCVFSQRDVSFRVAWGLGFAPERREAPRPLLREIIATVFESQEHRATRSIASPPSPASSPEGHTDRFVAAEVAMGRASRTRPARKSRGGWAPVETVSPLRDEALPTVVSPHRLGRERSHRPRRIRTQVRALEGETSRTWWGSATRSGPTSAGSRSRVQASDHARPNATMPLFEVARSQTLTFEALAHGLVSVDVASCGRRFGESLTADPSAFRVFRARGL
jgi:hypothetical protein